MGKRGCGWLLAGVAWICGIASCARESPPEIRQFVPPAVRMIAEEEPTSRPVVAAAPTPAPKAPEPTSQPTTAPAPVEVVEAPVEEPEPVEPAAPSIVGSWRIVEISRQGQTQPMPAGMDMNWTFEENGTYSMSMTGGPGGGQQMDGSYTLSGESITISMQGQTQSGTVTFNGNDQMTFDLSEAVFTFARQ